MATAVEQLKEHLGEIADINTANSVLGWDQQTYMPAGGGGDRAQVMGTLSGLSHSKFTGETTARLLDAAEPEVSGLSDDADDKCLVKIVRRDYEKSRKLPDEFVGAWTRDAILSNEVWRKARGANDFGAYKPHLQKQLEYARKAADYYGYEDHPYDALLDDYEPGLKTADVRRVFDAIRPRQVALAKAIAAKPQPNRAFLSGEYDEKKQGAFAMKVVQDYGYDLNRGRLDVAPHPFETSFSVNDVRITTRYDKNFPQQAIFAIFHEAGHGMYEQNVSPSLARTPLSSGCSNIFHESQSRTWENMVGRSRGVWEHYFPLLAETFPDTLKGVSADDFYRAINHVQPSLVRVEADEVTYNLHIMLRFELELKLVTGEMKVDDLPDAWSAHMEDFLGVQPSDDKDGVMQDTHWSTGSFGYFATYALGNVMGAQIFNTAVSQKPQIPDELKQGKFNTLFTWLSENLYRHGRKFEPKVLALKVNGVPLDPQPYMQYLESKYGELYGVTV